jgi:hypothetical protein
MKESFGRPAGGPLFFRPPPAVDIYTAVSPAIGFDVNVDFTSEATPQLSVRSFNAIGESERWPASCPPSR